MPSQFEKDRRNFMRSTAFLVPSVAIFGATSLEAAPRTDQPDPAQDITGAIPEKYQPLYFKQEELKFIEAACDVLIPHDEIGPGALETQVPAFIDRQLFGYFGHAATWYMEGPFQPDAAPDRGYQSSLTPQQLYRQGIAELDNHCRQQYGKTFSELDKADQTVVLEGVEAEKITSANVRLKTFLDFLIQNTKEGYFADPAHGSNKNMQSWTMIGYPGARASYLEWVEKYDTPYPLGPTSMLGSTL
jgi:gluconate 2-dehydrogenase gamma chain